MNARLLFTMQKPAETICSLYLAANNLPAVETDEDAEILFRRIIQENHRALITVPLVFQFTDIPLFRLGEIPEADQPSVKELLSFYSDMNYLQLPEGFIQVMPGLEVEFNKGLADTYAVLNTYMNMLLEVGLPADMVATLAPIRTTVNRTWYTNLLEIRQLHQSGFFEPDMEIMLFNALSSLDPRLTLILDHVQSL